jgi:hypothetical protein
MRCYAKAFRRGAKTVYRNLEDVSALNQLYQDLIQYLYPRLDALSAQHVDRILHGQLVKVRPHVYSCPTAQRVAPFGSSRSLTS